MNKRLLMIIFGIVTLAMFLTGCSNATGTAVNTWGGAAVDGDMVYYASGAQVLALSDSGLNYTVRWTYPEKANAVRLFMAEPLVVGEQLILGDYGSNLTSISTRDGVENWMFTDATGRYVDTPLLVGELLIAPNADNSVYAVDLDGNLSWKFSADGAFWARPATDGKLVFVPSLNHKLYAVDISTGNKTWEVDLNSPLVARPIYAEGIVYLGNLTGEFFAINAENGSIVWTQKVSGGIWAQPTIQDEKLYFGDQEGKLNILEAADGKIFAEVDAGSAILGAGAIVPEGIIFGTENGKIILFDAEGKSRPLLTLENGSIYSNIIVEGERMIVLAYKGNKPLIALDLNGNEAWYYSTKK